MRPEILVLPTPAAVADALATRTATALRDILATQSRATLCLTGGSTPAPAYRQLAEADGIEWDRVHVFWGDDRAVGPDHADSNVRMAHESLLDAIALPESNVHRIEGEHGSEQAARRYEQTLMEFFGGDGVQFDVLHLGMGADGHTASLFPGSPALGEHDRWAIHTEAPPTSPIRDRVTLTFPALNRARTTFIAAHGAGKQQAFADVLEAYNGARALDDAPPVAQIQPEGSCVWLVDLELANGAL